MDRQDDDPTNASGTEISRNIAKLAERRTDIFGVGAQGAEQTIIGRKLGEEEHTAPRSDSKAIWDGQQSTIDATTRAAQHAITLDQQISEIQRQHGYQPDPNKERIGPKGVVSTPTPTTSAGTIKPPVAPPVANIPQPPSVTGQFPPQVSTNLKAFRIFLHYPQ